MFSLLPLLSLSDLMLLALPGRVRARILLPGFIRIFFKLLHIANLVSQLPIPFFNKWHDVPLLLFPITTIPRLKQSVARFQKDPGESCQGLPDPGRRRSFLRQP